MISCLVLQSENFGEMRERARSKNRKARQQLEEQIDTLLEAEMEAVPRPRLSKLWPIQLVIFLVMSVLNAPQNIRRRMEEKEEMRRQEEEEQKRMEEEESKDFLSYDMLINLLFLFIISTRDLSIMSSVFSYYQIIIKCSEI